MGGDDLFDAGSCEFAKRLRGMDARARNSRVIGYACDVVHLLRTYTIVISVVERE